MKKNKKKLTYNELVERLEAASSILCAAAAEEHASRYLHKLIDDAVQVLQGDNYDTFVREAKAGESGPDTYAWHRGENEPLPGWD